MTTLSPRMAHGAHRHRAATPGTPTSDARLRSAVRAMDSISRSLVRPVEGPRGLLEQVVRAAGHHLRADWTVLALADGQLSSAGPRSMVADASGRVREPDALPAFVRRELAAIRAGHLVRSDERWVRVPMSLEGRPIGSLSLNCAEVDLESGDLCVLRILANQAGVSLHTAEQYRTGVALHHLAQRRHDEARPGEEPVVEVKRGSLPECTLTARESEVLGLLAQGCSNREIGSRLFISETTAKFHVGNILRKLGASSRAEAVYAASKLGAI